MVARRGAQGLNLVRCCYTAEGEDNQGTGATRVRSLGSNWDDREFPIVIHFSGRKVDEFVQTTAVGGPGESTRAMSPPGRAKPARAWLTRPPEWLGDTRRTLPFPIRTLLGQLLLARRAGRLPLPSASRSNEKYEAKASSREIPPPRAGGPRVCFQSSLFTLVRLPDMPQLPEPILEALGAGVVGRVGRHVLGPPDGVRDERMRVLLHVHAQAVPSHLVHLGPR